MPSRLVTAAILIFWLAMTGWLIQREVVPMIRADISPTFTPDLTDEIGSPQVEWKIVRDGKRAGRATSQVIANDDRTYSFVATYRFRKFSIGVAEVHEIEMSYKVSDEGKLKSMATKVIVSDALKLLGDKPVRIDLRGDVVDGEFQPRCLLDGIEEKLPDTGPIRIEAQGNIINPMHLLNRMRGLRDGQTWKIPMIDMMQGIKRQLPGGFAKQMTASSLVAVVSIDTLAWDKRNVVCYKIEYHEPGKDTIVAKTWVRKLDGLVLQQESSQLGIELVLERVP